jgi:small GTP-binding protein
MATPAISTRSTQQPSIFDQEYSYLVRMITVGEACVGKTCLVHRYDKDQFDQTTETIGVDFTFHFLDVDADKVKVQIWDTAGQERFQAITTSYYRSVHAVAFVYNLNQPETLDRLRSYWIPSFLKTIGTRNVSMIIIGNQADKPHTKSVIEEANELARHFNVPHYVVSAKTGQNVAEAFDTLASNCLREQRDTTIKRRDIGYNRLNKVAPRITLGPEKKSPVEFFKSWCFIL